MPKIIEDHSKIIAISDIHGFLPEVPACDVLIIAGDVCPIFDHSVDFQFQWLDTNFRSWLNEQHDRVGKIIGIAGNHDFVFEQCNYAVRELHLPWTYLEDTSVEHDGLKYYGLPWCPHLRSWAFYGNEVKLHTVWEMVPEDTDIIIAHDPPLGYLDECPRSVGSESGNVALWRVKPQAYICGHIHECFGKVAHPSGTDIYNVSYVDGNYQAMNRFTVVEL